MLGKIVNTRVVDYWNGKTVKYEEYVTTSISWRRVKKTMSNWYMKGTHKKKHVRWIAYNYMHKASYSRKRRILFITRSIRVTK